MTEAKEMEQSDFKAHFAISCLHVSKSYKAFYLKPWKSNRKSRATVWSIDSSVGLGLWVLPWSILISGTGERAVCPWRKKKQNIHAYFSWWELDALRSYWAKVQGTSVGMFTTFLRDTKPIYDKLFDIPIAKLPPWNLRKNRLETTHYLSTQSPLEVCGKDFQH